MNIDDPTITALKAQVSAARDEFDLAVTFHETWKPALYDEDLRKRMGSSYATQAFHIVRLALRREMLLALVRLWDKDRKAVRLDSIAKTLRDKRVIDALAADRAARRGMPEDECEMSQDLSQRAADVATLVDKYSQGGSHYSVLAHLKRLRNKRLAHREIEVEVAAKATSTDDEIEAFYHDMSEIIRLLLSLVLALAYDPEDTAGVYRHYAKFFWAGVRGERTEGHPNFRAPSFATSAE